MTSNVTLHLTDELYQKSQAWATLSGRPLESFLAETIEVSLLPFDSLAANAQAWSDHQLTNALANEHPGPDDARLSALLKLQREAEITAEQMQEHGQRMTSYQRNLLI